MKCQVWLQMSVTLALGVGGVKTSGSPGLTGQLAHLIREQQVQ